MRVFINPGHGGSDGGATGNGLKEKDLNLKIGESLFNQLKDYNQTVKMFRNNDTFKSLGEISNEANRWNADLFISIHINAGGGKGFETYRFNGGTSANTKKLQSDLHKGIMGVLSRHNVRDRGQKTANFSVLRRTQMPAVLTENLFVDSTSDANLLKKQAFINDVAKGHLKGIVAYTGAKKTGGSPTPPVSKPIFIYPTGTKNITSGFRPSHRPNHHGTDFADGTVYNITASAGGIVTRSYLSTSYGETVFIKHLFSNATWETVYAHMKSGTRKVKVGDTVKQGQIIGVMGNTGRSSGLHLHFEIHQGRWNANKTNAVNPMNYLTNAPLPDTSPIPKPDPNKPISSNNYLSQHDMKHNAQFVANYFASKGWTPESISGMLGNMERESNINPGVWQGLKEGNLTGGLGLTQWTPASKLISWAETKNYDPFDLYTQMERILWELDNNKQYFPTDEFPATFQEFTQSVLSPETLASAFLKNYERAGVEVEGDRRDYAKKWFNTLDWSGYTEPIPQPEPDKPEPEPEPEPEPDDSVEPDEPDVPETPRPDKPDAPEPDIPEDEQEDSNQNNECCCCCCCHRR